MFGGITKLMLNHQHASAISSGWCSDHAYYRAHHNVSAHSGRLIDEQGALVYTYISMAPSISYYCPCDLPATALPPPPHLASSSSSFHPLHTLFFCEECDAVRCNRCVTVEVSGYYCPNCLFEVPSASVRAEKNR